MGAVFSASTSGVCPSDRIHFWNSGSSRIGGVQAVAMSDVFDAQITSRQLDDVTVFALESTPHRVTANSVTTGQDHVLRLRYQQSGTSMIMQSQASCELQTGDWMIIDPRLPHIAVNEGEASHLWLQVPYNRFSPAEVRAAQSLRGRLNMCGTHGESLHKNMWHALNSSDAQARGSELDLARELVKTFRQTLGKLPQSHSPSSSRDDTVQRVRCYIERNLHDPDLSVERIAAEIGCTPRYVHKAFEGGESVSRYIWNRRLELCRQRLERPPLKSRTLTDLAFDHGFNSSSHFSRSFRERFGTSPSTYMSATNRGRA